MKKIFVFILICFTSCSKDEDSHNQNCKTCTDNVTETSSSSGQSKYIGSITTYCNGEWVNYDGKTTETYATYGAGNWVKKVHHTTCQ